VRALCSFFGFFACLVRARFFCRCFDAGFFRSRVFPHCRAPWEVVFPEFVPCIAFFFSFRRVEVWSGILFSLPFFFCLHSAGSRSILSPNHNFDRVLLEEVHSCAIY